MLWNSCSLHVKCEKQCEPLRANVRIIFSGAIYSNYLVIMGTCITNIYENVLRMFQWRISSLRLYITCSAKHETEMNRSGIASMDLLSNVDNDIEITNIRLCVV